MLPIFIRSYTYLALNIKNEGFNLKDLIITIKTRISNIVNEFKKRWPKWSMPTKLSIIMGAISILITVIIYIEGKINSVSNDALQEERYNTLIKKIEEVNEKNPGLFWNIDGLIYTDDKEVEKLINDLLDQVSKEDYKSAIEQIETGLVLTMNPLDKMNFFIIAGEIHYVSGSYEKAKEYHHLALKILERDDLPNRFSDKRQIIELQIYINLARDYNGMGLKELALSYYLEAEKIGVEINNESALAIVMGNLGVLDLESGRYKDAKDRIEKALLINKKLGNYPETVDNLVNLSGIVFYLGDLEKSKEYLEMALEISNKYNYRYGKLMTLINNGSVEFAQGNMGVSLSNFQESLKLSRELGAKKGEIDSLQNIAVIYTVLKKWEEAIIFANEALDISKKSGITYSEVALQIVLGNIYIKTGELEKAMIISNDSLELSRKIGYKQKEIINLLIIANIYSEQKDLTKSFEFIIKH